MRWIRAHFWLVLIYVTFATAGSYWLAQRIRFCGVKNWPSVDAHIIASGGGSYTVRTEYWDGSGTSNIDASYVHFEYTVAGRTYDSDLATPDGGGLPLYPTLTIVDHSGQRDSPPHKWKAFYKPTSPSTAVLVPIPYEGMAWLYTTLVCGLLIAVHLACTLPEKLEWLRWMRIAANRRAEPQRRSWQPAITSFLNSSFHLAGATARRALEMTTYQFLLHSTGVMLDMGDGEPPAVGFLTSRRARAPNSSEARKIVMAAMDDDPKLADIFASAHAAGLHPMTEVQEISIIPWWRAILPWRKPGLVFYPEDSEGEDSEPTAGTGNANKP